MQDNDSLRPSALRSHPFRVRRTAAAPGAIPVSITLHLVDAIAPDRRTVALQEVVSLLPGHEYSALLGSSGKGQRKRASAAERSKTVSFRTQEVVYDHDVDVLD